MLTYNIRWRVQPPADGRYTNSRVPDEAVEAFYQLASHSAPAARREDVLWKVKAAFAAAVGQRVIRSSNLDFARHDARDFMNRAAERPPQFLEAYQAVCAELAVEHGQDGVPDVNLINQVCVENNLGYRIDGAQLVLREEADVEVVEVAPRRLLDEARDEVRQSLQHSTDLLNDGRGREAVQEVLWLLETISTAFQGARIEGQVVRGNYFNQIVTSMRRAADGRILARVLEWLENVHGFLSAPGGGGVRHGANLNLDALEIHEATLFVNLVRSFVNYLLSEYERLPG